MDGPTKLLLARGTSGARVLLIEPPSQDALDMLREAGAECEALTFDFRKRAFARFYEPREHEPRETQDEPGADIALIYLPKGKERQIMALELAADALSAEGEVRVAGGKRQGIKPARKLVAARFAEPVDVTSGGHAQCIVARQPRVDVGPLSSRRTQVTLSTPGAPLEAVWYPGVYGANKLDDGTALLLQTLHADDGVAARLAGQSSTKPVPRVLDVGCGSGVIGAWIARQAPELAPELALQMVDIDALSLLAARETLAENRVKDVDVLASDVFSHVSGSFDWIVSNPPFHDGADTSFDAAARLIADAPKRLRRGGRLTLVANTFLPYRNMLDQAFGGHRVLAEDKRFRVYEAKA